MTNLHEEQPMPHFAELAASLPHLHVTRDTGGRIEIEQQLTEPGFNYVDASAAILLPTETFRVNIIGRPGVYGDNARLSARPWTRIILTAPQGKIQTEVMYPEKFDALDHLEMLELTEQGLLLFDAYTRLSFNEKMLHSGKVRDELLSKNAKEEMETRIPIVVATLASLGVDFNFLTNQAKFMLLVIQNNRDLIRKQIRSQTGKTNL